MADAQNEVVSDLNEAKGYLRSFMRFASSGFKALHIQGIKLNTWRKNSLAGKKTYKQIMKNALTTTRTTLLSKKDLEVLEKAAKRMNLTYAIVKMNPDKKISNYNLLSKIRSNFFDDVEKAEWFVVYDAKENEFMAYALEDVIKARIQRQESKDITKRTDFNLDGVIDEKDLAISSYSNEKTLDDLKDMSEHGTVGFTAFKNKSHGVFEISKEDYLKVYKEALIEVPSFSAFVNRNINNEDIVTITLPIDQINNFETILNQSGINKESYSLLEIGYDKETPRFNLNSTIHMNMNEKEFKKFKNRYDDVAYNAYRKNGNWKVIVDEGAIEKKHLNNLKSQPLENTLTSIDKEQIKDINIINDIELEIER